MTSLLSVGGSKGFFMPQLHNIVHKSKSTTKANFFITIINYFMGLSNYNKYFFTITVFLLLITIFTPKIYANPKNSSNVPDDIIFFDEEKNQYSLDQFEGKTILLVFWATWSANCVKEMPDLDILQKDFRKLPFSVIPVSEDYQDVKVIMEYYKSYQIRYLPIYQDYRNQLFKALGVISLPTSILIDPNGKIVTSFIGNTNWYDEKIRETILSAIPGNHPEPKNSYNGQSLNKPAKPLQPIKKKEQ
jgi:thiol-disulfide isomerase/thioredoxin